MSRHSRSVFCFFLNGEIKIGYLDLYIKKKKKKLAPDRNRTCIYFFYYPEKLLSQLCLNKLGHETQWWSNKAQMIKAFLLSLFFPKWKQDLFFTLSRNCSDDCSFCALSANLLAILKIFGCEIESCLSYWDLNTFLIPDFPFTAVLLLVG